MLLSTSVYKSFTRTNTRTYCVSLSLSFTLSVSLALSNPTGPTGAMVEARSQQQQELDFARVIIGRLTGTRTGCCTESYDYLWKLFSYKH